MVCFAVRSKRRKIYGEEIPPASRTLHIAVLKDFPCETEAET